MTPGPTGAGGAVNEAFPPGALRGAVDLGALAAARDAARDAEQRKAERQAGGGPATVVDVTAATFQAEVVDRSFTTPVVVDLWATWCQPCKQLSPVLEKLAEEADGAWLLAKVDIDAEREIAAAFQVQSVPAVVAILKGQPVPMFSGALPEAQVRQVIAELLKVAKQNGIDGRLAPEPGSADDAEPHAAGAEPESRYASANAAFEAGDWDGAASAFQAILDRDPGDAEAIAGLVRCQVMRRTDGVEPAVAIAAADSRPDDLDAALTAADCELVAGQVDRAFDRLTEFVSGSAGDDRDRARAHVLELFEMVGLADPAVGRARTRLASALF